MSDSAVIHGYFFEAFRSYRTDDYDVFRRSNDATIAGLPERDPWPPLARPMVSTTGPDDLSGSMKGTRLIVVAGHLNYIYDDDGIARWLGKLEQFLRSLYWVSGHVDLHAGIYGSARLDYQVKPEVIGGYSASVPGFPAAWTLKCLDLNGDSCQNDFLVEIVAQRPGYSAEPPPWQSSRTTP